VQTKVVTSNPLYGIDIWFTSVRLYGLETLSTGVEWVDNSLRETTDSLLDVIYGDIIESVVISVRPGIAHPGEGFVTGSWLEVVFAGARNVPRELSETSECLLQIMENGRGSEKRM